MGETRKGPAMRGTTDPALLLTRCLGTIDRMAEAMWQDESLRASGRKRAIKWEDEGEAIRSRWTRSAAAGFLALLEPQPEES